MRPDTTTESWRTAIMASQIAALFRSVATGVSAASLAAVLFSVFLARLDLIEPRRAIAWTVAVIVCAAIHILLAFRFRRDQPTGARLNGWATAFTIVCLAEGICWGYASTGLVAGSELVVALMALAVTLGASAGAIPAFSSYIPAYLGFLLPANLPFVLANIGGADPLRQASAILLSIFIVAMVGLGIVANRSFRELVLLRLKTEGLAADLRRQKELAEDANRAKSAFLAAASHDLRQPVHALSLFLGALRGLPLIADARRLVDQMEGSMTAMEGLFNSLLDISKLDAGVVEAHPRPFPLAPLIARVVHDHRAEASAKGLKLSVAHTSAVVHSDPLLIERILRNLVSNAVRYTDRGKVLIGCRRKAAGLRIMVLDTGRGIPAEEHGRIFTEYYQLGNSERDRAKGLGLGLAIVQRLATLLACPLSLTSEIGRGSRFEILVPRIDDVTAQKLMDELTDPILTSGFLVVIDDEKPIRDAMEALLTSWGHRVLTAPSGDEALAMLADQPSRPDLILCDYRLRDSENGIEVIERLRSEFNHPIPAFLISGDTAPDRLAEAEASGLVLLHKPIPNSRLRAAINNLMSAPQEEEA